MDTETLLEPSSIVRQKAYLIAFFVAALKVLQGDNYEVNEILKDKSELGWNHLPHVKHYYSFKGGKIGDKDLTAERMKVRSLVIAKNSGFLQKFRQLHQIFWR